MAALLICYSATAQTVDEAWAASPATTDSQWAQANSAPVNPANNADNLIPRGTMCGVRDTNMDHGAWHDCDGHNPAVSCPTGWAPRSVFAADGHWFRTCVKQ